MILDYPNLRAPANLAATVSFSTGAVPIKGAQQVAFHLAATNNVQLASGTIEVRKDGGAWVTAAAGIGVVPGGSVAAAMNAGGITLWAVAGTTTSTQAASPGFPCWDEARLTVVGHATNTINGLAIKGQVIRPTVNLPDDILTTPSA